MVDNSDPSFPISTCSISTGSLSISASRFLKEEKEREKQKDIQEEKGRREIVKARKSERNKWSFSEENLFLENGTKMR